MPLNSFRFLFILFLLNIVNKQKAFCQENNIENRTMFLGIETGISFNEVEEEIDRIFKDLPKESYQGYIGIVSKFNLSSKYFSILTGIRFQPKGDTYIKSKYILLPLQLDFYVLRSKEVNLGLVGGTALALNLSDSAPSSVEAQKTALNWRIGLNLLMKPSDDIAISFQALRTIGPRSYKGLVFSPGGASNRMYYKNSGLEFGMSILKPITK